MKSPLSNGKFPNYSHQPIYSSKPVVMTPYALKEMKEIENDEDEFWLSNDVGVVSAKQGVSSCTISIVVHAIIIFLLTILLLPRDVLNAPLEASFSTEIGDQLDFLTNDEGNLNPNDAINYELTIPEEVRIDDVLIFEEKELAFDATSIALFYEQTRIEASEMLSGRTDPGLKNDLLSKYGGNKTTEEAVRNGLEWLRKQQQKDGSWSLKGPYSQGLLGQTDNRPAATALALLAFQGAGNTRNSGEFSGAVRRGWNWLLRQQDQRSGCFTPKEHVHEALFYTHAIGTLALCELITLEKKAAPDLLKRAQLAVDYLLENQNKNLGGWKYEPQVGSDLSVTTWCLMALRTAEMAGIKVPNTNYNQISDFLDSVAYDGGAGYFYEINSNGRIEERDKRPSMTASGLLCREYLGWPQNKKELLLGAEQLASKENLVRFPTEKQEAERFSHNIYGWYATSMALKGLGPYNKHWQTWNRALSSELPSRQEQPNTQEAGSWNPQYDEYAFGGGRLYVTCMAILSLEVYYRHMPIYQ